ncbi:MAG: succinate dehydrogenase, hydrophobic membrane anchor protein [Gammaproteobacteria bacterium]|nr:succinate dehydrogenase, hydrophobic membrane anchor protein [Gammaproteobacteria bacterium]NIR85466.1 succinate dehydrogenase, hydrophobic membrane anchor protein [Gammaproteobacteria bacterium]NIR89518.1 succinate dehydrogenase, hydrophobic membrane anchor protein [Gammaproteobacteria bacterium]NIU06603.1 succinate dehydrogenase, hydrophobic membrane anchor protein [Gammaproteobacteria bacterium]NIV53486.1 succinate dehydrogenase, hydrophobic membrane anchor protein [Gammaproteobacteria ba
MKTLRTPLGQVRGLGAAKEGVHHWRMQRLTALALVPLLLWFVASLVATATADYTTAVTWVRSPVVTVLLLGLIAAVFYHAQLGMQVIIEDYVHAEWLKVTSVVALYFLHVGLALASALAVLRIALGG